MRLTFSSCIRTNHETIQANDPNKNDITIWYLTKGKPVEEYWVQLTTCVSYLPGLLWKRRCEGSCCQVQSSETACNTNGFHQTHQPTAALWLADTYYCSEKNTSCTRCCDTNSISSITGLMSQTVILKSMAPNSGSEPLTVNLKISQSYFTDLQLITIVIKLLHVPEHILCEQMKIIQEFICIRSHIGFDHVGLSSTYQWSADSLRICGGSIFIAEYRYWKFKNPSIGKHLLFRYNFS